MWLRLPCTWHPTNRNSSWRQVWSSTAGCLERSSRFALLGLGFGLQAFSQQAFQVQPLAAEAEVVVVAPCGQEQSLRHAKDHVKSKDVDVEVMHAIDVRCLEVDVADSGTRSDWSRRALPGSD